MFDLYNKNLLSEKFILTTHIEISEDKIDTFIPHENVYRMKRDNNQLVLNGTAEDVFFTDYNNSKGEEILNIIKSIKKPKLRKKIEVDFNISLEHQSQQIQEIRHQLQIGLQEITLDKKHYHIFFHKEIKNNVYYLYNPKMYDKYVFDLQNKFLELCVKWNNTEYERLLNRIDEINNYSKSESAGKISHYLDEVKFQFEEWYRKNNYEPPIHENLMTSSLSNPNNEKKIIDYVTEYIKINTLNIYKVNITELAKEVKKFAYDNDNKNFKLQAVRVTIQSYKESLSKIK